MSAIEGANIVTTGLIFNYDMNNSRSWIGAPVTNQFAVPDPYNSAGDVNFAVQGTTGFRRIYSGTFGGYTITSNDVVYRYDLGSNGCHYHGNSVSIPAGVYPIFRFDYYMSPDTTGFPTNDFLANIENYGGGAQSAGAACPNYNLGVWQTVTFSGGLTGSTGTQAMFLYPGGCGGRLATGGYILYKNPQVLFSSTANFVAPFVGPTGTRSNTQALLDLTQSYSITLNSLTYATNNTFSFNGSGDYMTPGNIAASGNAARSMFAWVKASSAGGRCMIATGTAANSQAFNLVTYGSNKVGVMGYNNDFYPSSGANIFDNVWHYVGAVANGSNGITTYVDGVQDNTGTITYATAGQTNYIGKSNHVGAESYWNGSIAGVQIYNVGLTAAQVAQNFAAQRSLYGV